MAVDYVSLLRNSPSLEIAVDNALFLAAKEASFLQKDIQLTATEQIVCVLEVTRPSLLIGSFKFSGPVDIRLVDLIAVVNPSLFQCELSGHISGGAAPWAALQLITTYSAVVAVDTNTLFLQCKLAPGGLADKLRFALVAKSNSGANALAGSYFKLV